MNEEKWNKFSKKLWRRVDSISKLCDELVEAGEESSDVFNLLWETLGSLMMAEHLAKRQAGIEPNPYKRMKKVVLTLIESNGHRLIVSGLHAKNERGLHWDISRIDSRTEPQTDESIVDVVKAVLGETSQFLGIRM